MTKISDIFAFFAAQIAFGTAIILPFMPNRATGKSYQRFNWGFILFFLGIYLFLLHSGNKLSNNHLIMLSLAGWIFILSFLQKEFTRIDQALNWAFALISLGFLIEYPQKYMMHGLTLTEQLWPLACILTGSLFISSTLMTMIFGHWYLINPSLPISHLIKVTRFQVFLTYARVITVSVTLWIAHDTLDAETFSRLTDLTGHGIFFWARLMAGLAVPVLVAHLAYASAKIKSNQSATGILYAGCVFVIMGELMAIYIMSLLHIYL